MTYIKRLEMQGFKSFANKINLDFSKGFSTFVGSNGSGKSNVIDAICFVLGKTSKKSMRANMLSDLIFNGGKKGKPSKHAEVSLVFDNSNGEFPYDPDEFKISRRVLKEGNSVYKINGKQVKRQEIINSLTKQNIDPDGFNIIMQGDIQKFVDLSGDERRKIIEDVSGISVYEDKKNKSIRELDKVGDKLKEARTRLAERERYLKEIINDKKQAEKYLKMKNELEDKKASLLFKKIDELEKERGVFDEKIRTNNDKVKGSQEEIKSCEQKINDLTDELTQVKVKLTEKGDAEQQRLSKKVEGVKEQKLELKNVINNHEREIKRIKSREQSVKEELKDVKLSIKKVKSEIKQLKKDSKSIRKELITKKEASGLDEAAKLTKVKDELLSVEQRIAKLKNELLISQQAHEYSEELETARKKQSAHEKNLQQVNKSLNNNEQERSKLLSKKQEVDEYLGHLNRLRIKIEAKKDAYLGYGTKGVKSVLRAGDSLKGVHGTIASLGLTDKRFTTALNVAAGSRLNAVITTDDKSAQQCIEFLRHERSGTASFIPLNKVDNYPVRSDVKRLINQPGVIDLAINLIRFESKYRKAFELVLRDTLIVHDLDVARRIGNNVRMVTLAGDVVETTGLMTGGYRGSYSSGFQHEDVDEKLNDVKEKTRKYERYQSEINDALSIIQEELIKDREEKARLESSIKELNEAINRLKPRINKARDESSINQELDGLRAERKQLKKKLSVRVDDESLKESKNEIERLEDEYNQLIIKQGTLEGQLDKVLLKEQERFDEILSELSKELDEFKSELKKARTDLSKTNKELKDLKAEESKFYKELKDLYDKRDELSKKIEVKERRIKDLERETYSVREKNQELNIKRASIVAKLDGLRVAFNEFGDWEPKLSRKPVKELQDEVNKLEVMIRNFGPVNMKSIETYKEVEKEFDKIKEKTNELSSEKEDIINVIEDIELKKKEAFLESFNRVNNHFEKIFAQLSPGGIAKLLLDDPDNPLEGGVTAIVRPKGKKILTLKSMSGGEKTLTALAFIFAIQEFNPTPFYVLDEVDAALDKANTEKLAQMLSGYSSKAQFVVISHNDELISDSDYLYGVSMDKKGVSDIISIKLPE